MRIKSVKMKILKNKKMRFFLISQGSLNPKIRVLGQKVCPVARGQTDTHESDYRGHPFRVSGVFPSTYHQVSAQYPFGETKRISIITSSGSCQKRSKKQQTLYNCSDMH